MHKPRQRPRVARVLSYGKSHGSDWRRLNVCVIAGSFLLLALVALLQLRVAIGGRYVDQSSVNSSRDGRLWKGKLWHGGGGDGEEKGERMEQKMGNNGEFKIVSDMEGDRTKSSSEEEAIEEDEGNRFEEMENEMDMEDEEGDDFEGFGGGGGDAGEWQHHEREKRLLEEKEDGLGIRQQLMVGGTGEIKNSGDDAEGRMKGAGMVEAHQLATGAVNSSDSKKGVSTGLSIQKKVAKGGELQGHSGLFSSDDEPIDEETRERLEHMSNIEDVLMLSKAATSSDKKVSWGMIQDEQPSKKDKGSKVSLDPLNPENNPLLQDPDSLSQSGGGGLTNNDRALLKAFKLSSLAAHSVFVDQNVHLHASFQKTPDGRVEDDSKEGTRSQFVNLVAGEHKEMATEVPALDEARRMKVTEGLDTLNSEPEGSSNGHNKGEASLETLSGVPKTKESKRMRHKKKEGKKVETLNPKVVDMRGWGYFSGFRPEITFSSFVEKFLFDEKCSLRVFMAWLTPPWSFTVRHQRVLESLLYFHPTACVVVFSDTIELDFFKSFTDEGYGIATVMPVLEELLQNTPTDVFATIFSEWRMVDLFYIHYTELLRLGALYKYGGIYLDFDMIVLKPLTSLSNTIGSELLEDGNLRPNGAIMVFEEFSPFLNRSMVEFTATYDETLREWNGADLLDRVMKMPPEGSDTKLAIMDKPHVKPPICFFPLSSVSISRYFKAPEEDVAIAEELEVFNQILSQSFGVHLWNGLTFNLIPEPGSLVDKLMGRNCLHCTDIL